tara:strand:- start:614 stop:823 length:210 start_codon:yes stop_codon:yes gene_type:complete
MKYNDDMLIPAFIRKNKMKVNIDKAIEYLNDQIDKYNIHKDKSITFFEHQTNVKTLKHFLKVKEEKNAR